MSDPGESDTVEDYRLKAEQAKAGTLPTRAMRVTLECGHYRLMTWNACAMGIGSFTGCDVCPDYPTERQKQVGWRVVNVEETGRFLPDLLRWKPGS